MITLVEAGILTFTSSWLLVAGGWFYQRQATNDKRPMTTVAAQCWTLTSFHLYALASELSGHLNTI